MWGKRKTKEVTNRYVPDTGLGQSESEAGHSTAPRSGFRSPDAMRCSFLGNGLGDWAVILGVFKPVRLEG